MQIQVLKIIPGARRIQVRFKFMQKVVSISNSLLLGHLISFLLCFSVGTCTTVGDSPPGVQTLNAEKGKLTVLIIHCIIISMYPSLKIM